MEQKNPYIEEVKKTFEELSADVAKICEEYKKKVEKLEEDNK